MLQLSPAIMFTLHPTPLSSYRRLWPSVLLFLPFSPHTGLFELLVQDFYLFPQLFDLHFSSAWLCSPFLEVFWSVLLPSCVWRLSEILPFYLLPKLKILQALRPGLHQEQPTPWRRLSRATYFGFFSVVGAGSLGWHWKWLRCVLEVGQAMREQDNCGKLPVKRCPASQQTLSLCRVSATLLVHT